ncbi:hypothetical protein ACOMHN_039071 [Nucella lapillus]
MSTVAGTDQVKTRTPKCARCRNHGYTVNLRGHKGFCPHKNCTCDLCDLVKERQEVSKRQIKLRRQQQQEEVLGMYVPVPPTVFSQGSACGINLDYLRVLFPRKRVDRLYAVLLQCNNDVNAATAKLQQAPVVKINKATQWPADSDHNVIGGRPHAPKTSSVMTAQKGWPPQQQCNVKDAGDLHHGVSLHASFPYCWPHALPTHFPPPTGPVSLPSHDIFGTNSPRIKDHTFHPEPFPSGNTGVSLEGFESSGSAKESEQIREAVSITGSVSSTFQPHTLTVSQSLAGGMSHVSELDAGCLNPGCSQVNASTISKVSCWGGGPIYTSASTASIPMPRTAVPFSLPPPPLPPFAPGWDPRSLPPLPFLPSSVTSIFHNAPYNQVAGPFQLPPVHLPQSSALPFVKEVGPHADKAGEDLACPEDLLLSSMETSRVKIKPDGKMTANDSGITILEPCSDSEQFIDPTGF